MVLNYTPRTWVAAETVTATQLNNEIRDPLTSLQAAWDTYTPTWTGIGSNPSLGNGTKVGRYLRVGQTVDFLIEITAGSTTAFGSGQWQVTLPVVASGRRWIFEANAYDNTANDDFPVVAVWSVAGSLLNLKCEPTTAGNALRSVTTNNPFTWGNSDKLTISGRYEAA